MTIRGDLDFVARTGHLFSSVREEFVCAARDLDTWALPGARRAVRDGVRDSGVRRVRKLLGPVALAGEAGREHLRALTGAGAEVRIADAVLPYEAIVIDRRYAILAGPAAADGDREYTVTTAPTLVGGVCALLDAAWVAAPEPGAFLRAERPRLDAVSRTVLRALGSGATDENAARALGMSLRTYRRRVADLLRTLDADSRFQAGLRAGELGL